MEKSGKFFRDGISRRDFVRMTGTAAFAAAAGLGASSRLAGAEAGGTDAIRVGVIGCGGRGTGAAFNCLASAPGVELVAAGDLFEDRVRGAVNSFKEKVPAEKMKITDETTFVGFDAFEKVCKTDCNYVILAAPPGFRPQHLRAAIESGKNVFMEKPVAVDPIGYRSVCESSDMAKEKKLGIVAGTQRRHQANYIEIMKRIHDGAIGDIVAVQCYWNQGGLWVHEKKAEWSDMEWQCRNWLYFTWLSGDHIVEQHVHNLDVARWAIGGVPEKLTGLGGRQVRTEAKYGNIFDHFAIEYFFPKNVHVTSTCRQINGCSGKVNERILGTKGQAYLNGGGRIAGENAYQYAGENWDPYTREHTDLIESIRKGEPLNEGRQVADSTLMAIAGRMSAYTGREMSFEWVQKTSKLDIMPKKYEFGDLPVEPVAIPGTTQLI
ncbi:MAG TPA: Gfo/Idh/MocA family oxidoreductase [Candidatus Brocadiia bacterium]|nr:Gfo/Idh/MocA family oxidoreductase [Candidatus Brocadiia bacterium]